MLAVCVQAGITAGVEGWAYGESVEHMSPLLTGFVRRITHIGDSSAVIAFCLLLIAVPKTRKTIALPVSVSVILSAVLNIILKNIFVRQRPDILRLINETSYSFPSGHAMINGSLYTMLILLTFVYIKNTALKLALTFLCLGLTGAIGYSRVYLGVHYAGDVLGGWLIGFALSLLVYLVWRDRIHKKKPD
jgi:undecaprenyl-diphosphatase